MVERKLIVKNETGIHARPASQVVKKCNEFKSKVVIRTIDIEVNAKSIINILTAGLSKGREFTLCTDGVDEVAALEAISDLINNLIE